MERDNSIIELVTVVNHCRSRITILSTMSIDIVANPVRHATTIVSGASKTKRFITRRSLPMKLAHIMT
ncbi:MAG: hypothetical protein ACPLN2_04615 [Thermoproteota archaeon]